MKRFVVLGVLAIAACKHEPSESEKAKGVEAFATVEKVFQHPRCSNCHIPEDAPRQYDAQTAHTMNVVRGPDGHGAPTLQCSTCHGEANPPPSYGEHAPPGAPHWALPPPDMKMAWIGQSAPALCAMIKDTSRNGGRDFEALYNHIDKDKLVLWGWNPGGSRAPVPVPHDEFAAAFKTWADAGGPCPQ